MYLILLFILLFVLWKWQYEIADFMDEAIFAPFRLTFKVIKWIVAAPFILAKLAIKATQETKQEIKDWEQKGGSL